MMAITVVNKHTHISTGNDFYIGRGSALGNPYTSKPLSKTKAEFQCATPEESVSSFRKYLLEKITQKDKTICAALNSIWKMAKKSDMNLVCYCSPKCCHGDVIKEIVESKLK